MQAQMVEVSAILVKEWYQVLNSKDLELQIGDLEVQLIIEKGAISILIVV